MNWAEVIRRGRFVVVGRAGMDLYADPPGTRTEQATQFTAALGGSSANIAVALAQLGLKVALVSTVSDDAVGRFCLNELDRYGVDRTLVRCVAGEVRTSLAVVETRAVDTQSVIYRNNAADFALSETDVAAIDFGGVGALILTGTALAVDPSRTACFAAMTRAKTAGVPVVLDIDYRPYSWASQAEAAGVYAQAAAVADIIVGNDDEFGVLAGDHAQGMPCARAMGQTAAGFVIYKMGAKGAVTFTKDTTFTTPIFPVTALKPTGAGDAFMGGLLAGLATGLPLPAAVTQGAAAAAIVVTRVGCAPAMPTPTELAAFQEAHHAHSPV
jgi:5-dehydro-2-deoxygluconokinase